MGNDLEQAVRYALEPLTQQGVWTLCPHCGATIHTTGEHVCRTQPLELPGLERDEKHRARSYAID